MTKRKATATPATRAGAMAHSSHERCRIAGIAELNGKTQYGGAAATQPFTTTSKPWAGRCNLVTKSPTEMPCLASAGPAGVR